MKRRRDSRGLDARTRRAGRPRPQVAMLAEAAPRMITNLRHACTVLRDVCPVMQTARRSCHTMVLMRTEYELRPIAPDEVSVFMHRVETSFGVVPTDEAVSRETASFDCDRSLAVIDDGAIVGTAGAILTELTLPGLQTLPAAAVGYVTVFPTHRRRGLMRRMMARQLDDIRERGEPLAILYASESAIYSRFGYGMATDTASYAIRTDRAQFTRPVDYCGSVSLVEHEKARLLLPAAHEAARLRQPGAIKDANSWWEAFFDVPKESRTGDKSRFYTVALSESGEPEGYAVYGVKHEWPGSVPDNTVEIRRVVSSNDRARAALWDFLLRLDLVGTVKVASGPLDEPLRWWLKDSRRLRIEHRSDGLWVRIVDVCAALSARRYLVSGSLVLDVRDSFRPEFSGRFRLEGSPEGAECAPTRLAADLALEVEDLGSIYLGGHSPSMLARAGRIREETPGALLRATAMFAGDRLPWCLTMF